MGVEEDEVTADDSVSEEDIVLVGCKCGKDFYAILRIGKWVRCPECGSRCVKVEVNR